MSQHRASPRSKLRTRDYMAHMTWASRTLGGTVRGTRRFLSRQLWVWPIIAVTLLLAIGWGVHDAIESTMESNLQSQLETLLDVEVAMLQTWLAAQEKNAESLAGDAEVRQLTQELLKPAATDGQSTDDSSSIAVYSVYNPDEQSWSDWARVDLPDLPQFKNCSAGCAQRYDLPNGDVLLPVYFRPNPTNSDHRVTVVRCTFDGTSLNYVEHGRPIELHEKEFGHDGFSEPSLTRFKGRFYLTLRAVHRAYLATSDDGMDFDQPRRWRFDDGEELGSYNTQQHWVRHSEGLFLTYTRSGEENDHIFRHRAPIFMAQVDLERLVVIRESERIIVPETGTRMGNFGIVNVSPAESWVITTEWMQPHRPDLWKKYGTENRIFCARIQWSRPNRFAF